MGDLMERLLCRTVGCSSPLISVPGLSWYAFRLCNRVAFRNDPKPAQQFSVNTNSSTARYFGNGVVADTYEDRLIRHLKAIFATPCDCPDDEDNCPACIAEHALYFGGDHPATRALR